MEKLIDKDLFRVDEIAEYFSVTDRTVRLWIEHGHLKAERIGGSIRIPYQSVLDCRIGITVKNAARVNQL